jgi:hypothetical protein
MPGDLIIFVWGALTGFAIARYAPRLRSEQDDDSWLDPYK